MIEDKASISTGCLNDMYACIFSFSLHYLTPRQKRGWEKRKKSNPALRENYSKEYELQISRVQFSTGSGNGAVEIG